MVAFRTFPSAHWATHSAQSIAIVLDDEHHCTNGQLLPNIPSHINWQQWHRFVQQAVSLLQDLTAISKPLIAYQGVNRFCGLLCYSAALAMGGRVLMLNPKLSQQQQKQILQDNRVDLFLSDGDFFALLSKTCAELVDLDFSQPATLTLTSGSSGKPKAVVHSIQSHLDNAEGVCELMQFGSNSSWLLSLPLFHVSGQGIVWRWLSMGATLYLNDNKQTQWQTLAKVSHASLVPTQLQRYLAQYSVSQQIEQHILLGGAFIPPDLIQKAIQFGITTYAGYGMTEMASTICAVKNELDNVGYPLKGREVQIEHDEIWVKGAGLALGYWLDGAVQPLTNAQGWLATKDRGEWTLDSKLKVMGRLDNMFISGGENIQPEEIETVLYQSNLVNTAFVVPIVDKEFGERPVALIELKEQFHLQAVNLLQIFVKQHLESFKQPIAYLPLEPDKMQGSGIKISRKQLQQYVADTFK
ncbi:o-succinylbenzoate--CoA ligase [Pasteurellaceae bacterium 15-036681]|nr:o-succinylbenzoate--CoA ligase [Pasteurellaceae bacterium 15-036681]